MTLFLGTRRHSRNDSSLYFFFFVCVCVLWFSCSNSWSHICQANTLCPSFIPALLFPFEAEFHTTIEASLELLATFCIAQLLSTKSGMSITSIFPLTVVYQEACAFHCLVPRALWAPWCGCLRVVSSRFRPSG